MKFILAILLFVSFGESLAQDKEITNREQAWVAYFNQTRLTRRWGLWLDVHYRMTDNFVNRPFQLLIRPGISYYIKDNLRVNAGYALIEHFPAKGLKTTRTEHRSWQQVWWNQKYPGVVTLQWLRLEQRFNEKVVSDVKTGDFTYTFRTRYNFAFFIPLKGKEIVARTPFIAISDEVFLNFGKNVIYNTFDQNRLALGLGYQITSHLNAQLAYMNVYQQEASGSHYFSTHAVRLFVYHNIDLRRDED